MFEVMENRIGGMPNKLRVEQFHGLAHQLHGKHFNRNWHAFTISHPKQQTIRSKCDHCFPPIFLTSWTKSVASWNRRYTLANRTYATSSIRRNPSITSLPMTSPGTSRSYLSVTSFTISSTRFSMTFGLIGRF